MSVVICKSGKRMTRKEKKMRIKVIMSDKAMSRETMDAREEMLAAGFLPMRRYRLTA